MSQSVPVDYVFSASSARSGSTLMAFLLNTHPNISSIAEMDGLIDEVDPETFKCSCGELIKECPFWNQVTQNMRQQGYEFTYSNFDTVIAVHNNKLLWKLQKGSFRVDFLDNLRNEILTTLPGISNELMVQVERNQALARAILAVDKKQFLLDTSKDVSRIFYLNKHKSINLWVIHLTRDPRGVVASEFRRNPDLDIRWSADQWLKVNKRIELQSNHLSPEKYIHIRYEDLCTDTLATLNRITEFLGIEPFDMVPEFRNFPNHIIGAAMRLKSSSEIQLDKRWKTELTSSQVQAIDEVISSLAGKYNYL